MTTDITLFNELDIARLQSFVLKILLKVCIALSTTTSLVCEDLVSAQAFDEPKPALKGVSSVTSEVIQLVIDDLLPNEPGRGEIILYHRNGEVHHGYALLPDRDNLVHRVDVTPAPAVQWITTADNQSFVPPRQMMGTYAYKNKNFRDWSKRYRDGEIDLESLNEIPNISLNHNKVSGLIDILISSVDDLNPAGRKNHSLVLRISMNATVHDNGTIHGKSEVWGYADKDATYGLNNPRRQLTVVARLNEIIGHLRQPFMGYPALLLLVLIGQWPTAGMAMLLHITQIELRHSLTTSTMLAYSGWRKIFSHLAEAATRSAVILPCLPIHGVVLALVVMELRLSQTEKYLITY